MVTDKLGPGTVKRMRRKRTKRRSRRIGPRLAAAAVAGLAVVGLAAILSRGSWWPELRRALTRDPLPAPSIGTFLSEAGKGGGPLPQTDGERSEAAASAFSIAWISDTQVYAESYPGTFTAMTSWVEEQRGSRNIQALLHTGDVVNNRKSAKQWANAVAAMDRLRLE